MKHLTRRPIAHRGYHDGNIGRYENSLSAFDEAIAHDFAIELDVRLSADGKAMVFHDETLDRLTDRKGNMADRDAATLRGVRLGDTGEGIPTLAETLKLVAGRVSVVIEMKDDPSGSTELARAVASDLVGYQGPAFVMSFSHQLIATFRDTGSAFAFGLTAAGIGEVALDEHRKAIELGISFVSYSVAALPNRFVSNMREAFAMPVITWTVSTPEDVERSNAHADQMTFEGFHPDH